MIIDTHTHLYLPEFDADRDLIIRRAMEAGVNRFYMPNIDGDSIPALFMLADQYPESCFPMMGLHPCSVANRYAEDLKVVEYWLGKRKFSAVGEIGIDLYWDKTYYEQQKDAFRHQLRLARRYSLPVVIHTRNSFEETYQVIREERWDGMRGIFHCFSGSADQARRVLELGCFMLGIGGVITFRNSGLDKLIGEVGVASVVLETDAPYLAPVPHRGKRNEPAFLTHVVARLSEITGKTAAEVTTLTSENALKIFGK
ncbi:MAG: TatD family hydrolase [Bacteroidia bacterium]|nr:TatD family hydrolase [Bacteroidia bacterium]